MARYRAIEQSINELTDEIRGLELKRRDLSFQDKEHRSPCRVVADIFALLKSYFRSSGFHSKSKAEADHPATRVILNALRDLFVSDVESGNICGVDAFLGQVKTYAQLFDVPSLCLEKIVEDTPGVVAATAILQATVTISTLCFIFPHSLQVPRAGNDTQPLLGRRWLAKPLTCNCSVHFLFDAGSGRVARVEISIDWVSALLDVLGNLDDVVRALNSGFANS
ncbi:hypothetical protein DVH05_010329 [Phytophthora capsici]|nr:hypothetical protein DVH05_010329 [Phytophthora capsici]